MRRRRALVTLKGMLDPLPVLRRLGGVASVRTLHQHGFTSHALAQAARERRIRRVRRGLYADPQLPLAVLVAALHSGALTCVSILELKGVWLLHAADHVHVWLRPHTHPTEHEGCECVTHWGPGAPRYGMASVPDALVQLLRCQGDEAFFCAYESAWNRRLLSSADRAHVKASIPADARWMVDLARPDAGSGLESLTRLRLHPFGLHVQSQANILGIEFVDLLIEDAVIVEVDGRRNHETPERRHNDLRRDAMASELGLETLRFDYAQVVHTWEQVQASVLAAVARARARR